MEAFIDPGTVDSKFIDLSGYAVSSVSRGGRVRCSSGARFRERAPGTRVERVLSVVRARESCRSLLLLARLDPGDDEIWAEILHPSAGDSGFEHAVAARLVLVLAGLTQLLDEGGVGLEGDGFGFSPRDGYVSPRLSGHYYRLPAGTVLPTGLGVIRDDVEAGGKQPPTHHTIYPTRPMPFETFQAMVVGLPWEHAGNKPREPSGG